MIAFLLLATGVAVGGWYLAFVVLPPASETLPISRRAPAPDWPVTSTADHLETDPAHAWTALDDHQLARLLRGS